MSNKIYDERFYNEEQKIRFLSLYTDNNYTYTSFKRVLSRAHRLEESLNKDLYNFNQVEIEQLSKYLAARTGESLQHSLTVVQLYIRWAILENMRDNNINPADALSIQYMKRFVDNSAPTYFTGEDVFNVVDNLVNYQDKAVVLAIFEGIKGKKLSELLNLKRGDITESGILLLTDEDGSQREIEISSQLKMILQAAAEEKVYFKKNGKVSEYLRSSNKLELIVSPYVIRPANTNAQDIQADTPTVSRRFVMIAEFFKKPRFNPTNIRNSGMLYEGMKKCVENKSKGLTQQDYYDICTKFHTANKERYSYTFLKRSFLNEENIKELYGSNF